jgi:putative transposase
MAISCSGISTEKTAATYVDFGPPTPRSVSKFSAQREPTPRRARAIAGNAFFPVGSRKGDILLFVDALPLGEYVVDMPRTARASVGGVCYHVLNRGNGRQEVFRKPADYRAFLKLLKQASDRLPMRLLAYCLLPNHFHLVLWPKRDGELSRWMQWLMTAHVRRYHRHYGTSGHVWQGRFKAFPIQRDEHLLTVLRYVERNPVRPTLADRAEDWLWSSASGVAVDERPVLAASPVPRGPDWLKWVNQALTERELEAVRRSIVRGTPFGVPAWQRRTARRLGLESSLRPRGRPRTRAKK